MIDSACKARVSESLLAHASSTSSYGCTVYVTTVVTLQVYMQLVHYLFNITLPNPPRLPERHVQGRLALPPASICAHNHAQDASAQRRHRSRASWTADLHLKQHARAIPTNCGDWPGLEGAEPALPPAQRYLQLLLVGEVCARQQVGGGEVAMRGSAIVVHALPGYRQ